MSRKYLYGATVDGIQSFIFESNRLRDIVGASSLVHRLCTSMFDEFAHDGESIVRAAGHVKYLYDSREACEQAVRHFPRKVARLASGLSLSQAVVEIDDTKSFTEAVMELESRLRTARNRRQQAPETGLAGIERSRTTGRPSVKIVKGEHLDASTLCKRQSDNLTRELSVKSFGTDNLSNDELAYDIEDITRHNSWVAIVHADGNGLGRIVQTIGNEKDILALFSRTLDEATTRAANAAFDKVIAYERDGGVIPLRPIVLAGDDFTAVVRGDLALDYTKEFISAFEELTRRLFTDKIVTPHSARLSDKQKAILNGGLTACAGIAFVKASYPFYYGYGLAESLCGEAKKAAKQIDPDMAPSCLMFHKVQDSFVEDYEEIQERELTPCPGISYKFGPYYLHEQPGKWTMEDLWGFSRKLTDDKWNAVKSGLRKWMTTLAVSGADAARQFATRLKEVHPEARKLLDTMLEGNDGATPVYDTLAITSIIKTTTR